MTGRFSRASLTASVCLALAVGGAGWAILGCHHAKAQSESSQWQGFVDGFLESYFALNPDMAALAGRHEFDGRLPDWSPDGLLRMAGLFRSARQRAAAFDASQLTDAERFERDYFVSEMDGHLFWLEKAEAPLRNPTFYLFLAGLDPNVYVTRAYAPLEQRLQAYTRYAENVPRAVSQIKSNLRTPLPKTFVEVGVTIFGGLASFMADDVPKVFADVGDDALRERFAHANRAAAASMSGLEQWLDAQRADATDAFALGTDLFSEMLRDTDGVDVPLARLTAIGEADLARNLRELGSACEQFSPGRSVSECLAIANARKPADGPVQGAREQLAGLKRFIVEKQLVSIPSDEEARVEESPPFNRWNLAYIDIPGPYEKNLPSIYYISPPDPSWTAEEQAEYLPSEKDLLFISVHEVWPGHFLQFLHSNRSRSRFGQLFVGYAFAEGWAHYAEEMMWEAGLGDGDPATHIGQLLNALLRNVRYLSAIGLHTGSMTVAESERLFVESAFQDPGNARQQAARGTFDPAYLNYTLGKLMIRKLREDWTASRGGKRAWRAFHDQFLSYGGPPIPLLRKAMLGPESGPAL
jgi:uncharacterized protein (DUF885 family)